MTADEALEHLADVLNLGPTDTGPSARSLAVLRTGLEYARTLAALVGSPAGVSLTEAVPAAYRFRSWDEGRGA